VLRELRAATDYAYEVLHDGSQTLGGTFTTAPRGRTPLRFTSFGDQSTPEPGDGLASPWAGYNPPQVERLRPLFHLLNGDLCYANISPDRPGSPILPDADLGIRQEWLPLFDAYGVDLVVAGHEHHYERSLAVHGVDAGSETLRPRV